MSLGPAPALNPGGAGTALLNAVVAQLEAQEVNGRPWQQPTRVGFVPGALLAYDDDQLTVNWVSMTQGMPGREQNQPVLPYQALLFYEFSITLIRQVATVGGEGTQGGIPTITQLAVDASTVAEDAALLLAAVMSIASEALIVDIGIPFLYGPIVSIGPEGGLAGSRIPVSFQAGTNLNGGY